MTETGIELMTRWDTAGRDVTDSPGLWSEDDVEVCATNYSHPTITSGQHTNGPAAIWLRLCVDGSEWVNTKMTSMKRVRDAWVRANDRDADFREVVDWAGSL